MRSDTRIRAIAAAYPAREPRSSVEAVERLRELAGVALPSRNVAVVGTNGKTSTSVFLGRLVRGAGVREGVTTSPHITRWGERVAIDGVPVSEETLLERLEALHEAAERVDGKEALRFFDLLTLAAAGLFADAGVEVGVFEAGIGGRLDATRVLGARLAVLTGIGADHVDLLGESEAGILREKLGVVERGAHVISAALPAPLEQEARAFAAEHGLELELVHAEGDFLVRNAALARAAAAALGFEAPAGHVPEPVPGRLHRVTVDGVEVTLDAAHNPQAWAELALLLPASFVAVVSVSRDRPTAELRAALACAAVVVATEAWPGRSYAASELAAALDAEAVDDPRAAIEAGLAAARARALPLVVFGSTYLLTHAYAVL